MPVKINVSLLFPQLPRSVTDETLVQERLHRRLSSMEEELTIARRELLRRKVHIDTRGQWLESTILL